MTEKITSFLDLRAWQHARKFASSIYKATKNFPSDEKFALTSQIRRSAVSVAANIAEGFSRSGQAEKRNFYSMALGSLTETISHAYIAVDLGYLKPGDIERLNSEAVEISKMTNGLIKSAKGRDT